MAMASGYNIKGANDLMQTFANSYNDLDDIIKDEYNGVVKVLREEWVGDDEQSFEAVFATELSRLYENSYVLVDNCCKNISATVSSWINFQSNNLLDIDRSSVGYSIRTGSHAYTLEQQIVAPRIEGPTSDICVYDELTLGIDVDRGLTNSDSYQTIQKRMEDAKTNIVGAIDALIKLIDSGNAFYGDQTAVLNEYIAQVQKALSGVVTSFEGLALSLAKVAGENYTGTGDVGGMESFVSDQINARVEEVKEIVESSKWGSGTSN